MTVAVSNTNINDSFNTWRLNTNLAATVISNNVVTVSRAGSAERGGVAKGNGHVAGTFTANELRTTALKAGNTSNDGAWLYVRSNTSINATSLAITANTTFQGNVDFVTAGTDRVNLGNVTRLILSGGTRGQFLRVETATDNIAFKSLSLRDIADLSTNSAPIILSGANTTFSDNNDSPALILSNGTDRAYLYMASDAVAGDSDVYLNLVDAAGDSTFTVADSANSAVLSVDSSGNLTVVNALLPTSDDSVDIGAVGNEFKDGYFDGTLNTDILSVATGGSQGVGSSLIPTTDAGGNLGSTTRKWGTVWADNTNGGAGVFNTVGISDTLVANGNVTFRGDLTVSGTTSLASGQTFSSPIGRFTNVHSTTFAEFFGDTTIGNDNTDSVTFNAEVTSSIVPNATNLYNLGSATKQWANLFIDGVATIDTLTVDVDSTLGGHRATVSGNAHIGDTVILTNGIKDGATTIIGKNGKLHANNTITNDTITTAMIANTMNFGAGGRIHGSATQIPVIRVNAQGQVIGISNTSVSGVSGLTYTTSNNNIRISTATGTTYDATISPATTTSGTGRGVASFATADFGVSTGHVSLNDAVTKSVSADTGSATPSTHAFTIAGTSNEIETSATGSTVTIGLPTDVTVSGQLNVGENVVITGNLTVSGTTTTVNTETINLADNIIALNSNHSGAPTQDGGILVNRGTSANAQLQWSETRDAWRAGTHGGTFYDLALDDGTFAANTFAKTMLSVANSTVLLADKMSVANTQALANARLGATATVAITGAVAGGATAFSGNAVSISTTQQNNSVTLGTHTVGNYVATITGGTGLTSTGATTGEGIAHSLSVDADQRGNITQIGADTNDYYKIGTTQHNWFLDGAEDMRLTNDGTLDVEGSVVAFSATVSDERLKEDIVKVEDAVSKVQQLNGYTFSYKKDGKKSAGVIAQEVANVLPSAVKSHDVLGGEGEYLIVEYDQLTALLIESIKELKAEIDELKANK